MLLHKPPNCGRNYRLSVHPTISDEIKERHPELHVRSVLFVCKANAWRSPAAEAILRKMAAKEVSDNRLHIDSAGVSEVCPGQPAAWRLRWSAFRRGYRIRSRARRVLRTDLVRFDLVVVMDRAVMREVRLQHSRPTSKLALVSDFLGPEWPDEVPDPAIHGPSCLDTVFEMLETACHSLHQLITQLAK